MSLRSTRGLGVRRGKSGATFFQEGQAMLKPNLTKLFGKVQYVQSFADFKVQVVDCFEDLRVQEVQAFADGPGRWQPVKRGPDYKIKIVKSGGDFRIRYVGAFPGPS